jgi:hypothetical protein
MFLAVKVTQKIKYFYSCNAIRFNETSHRCDLFLLEEEKYQPVSGGSKPNDQSTIRVNEAYKKCELIID